MRNTVTLALTIMCCTIAFAGTDTRSLARTDADFQAAEARQSLEEDILWAASSLADLADDPEWRGQVFLATSTFLELRIDLQPLGYEASEAFATGAAVALVDFARQLGELAEFVPDVVGINAFLPVTVAAYEKNEEGFDAFVSDALERREAFRFALQALAGRDEESFEPTRQARRALLFMPLLSFLANEQDWIGLSRFTYIWPFC